jgi:hypothetical protein
MHAIPRHSREIVMLRRDFLKFQPRLQPPQRRERPRNLRAGVGIFDQDNRVPIVAQ